MSLPVDPERMRYLEHKAREIAAIIDKAVQRPGERIGFALMLFSFELGGEFTWISNAQRADMVRTMQEFIARNPPDQTSEGRN